MNLGWIEASLRYAGRFSASEKAAYRHIFDLSEPTASRHQRAVADRIEEICQGEVFRRGDRGQLLRGGLFLREDMRLPDRFVFDRAPSIERWLEDALGGRHYEIAEVRRADPDPYVLREVIRSVQDEKAVRIIYASRIGEGERVISPHVLVRAAGRLHVRGYDHGKNEFRDFVLSRILRITSATQERYVKNIKDSDWHELGTILIRDRGDAEGRVRSGVCRDYGLEPDGTRQIRTRKALSSYLVDPVSPELESPVIVEDLR